VTRRIAVVLGTVGPAAAILASDGRSVEQPNPDFLDDGVFVDPHPGWIPIA
jgi:hypothetical protein